MSDKQKRPYFLILAGLVFIALLGGGVRYFYDTLAASTESDFPGKGEIHVLSKALSVQDARVKETIPGIKVSSGYLTLINNGDKPLNFVSVESDAAKHIEFHRMFMRDSKMAMRKVDTLTVEPGSNFVLDSEGYHLMLMGLTERLEAGSSISITLTEDNGSQHNIDFVVASK